MMSLNRSFFVVFLIVATELIGFGLIIPVLPQLASQFYIDHFSLGILMSAFSFAQFIAAPILGHLSDIYGRKSILILSKCGTVLSYLVLAYAHNFWLFLLARLLDGFTGGNIAVARAYISDITTKETRSRGMAVIGMSFGLGFVLGPAIGGFLHNDVNGQFVTSLVAASLSLLAIVFTFFLLEEPQKKKHVSKKSSGFFKQLMSIQNRMIVGVCGIYFVYMIIFSGFEVTFSVFTDHMYNYSTKQNSFLFMYLGIIAILVQGIFMRKSFSSLGFLVFLGCGLLSIGFFGMFISSSTTLLLVFLTFVAVGFSFVNTFLPSLYSLYLSESNRGVALGIYESIGSICRMIGPIIAYLVAFDLLRYEYLAFSCTVFVLGCVAWGMVLKDRSLVNQ
ncbi:hypothetical protein DID78_04510 [Candidatus Marinamargulisbacteria bacterium SCGC AG-343-D04]|nr:hypothetical protein DID78_04510 [Candidatus Marinamargulisbacteria bacterium SCGC AG-343-D04]